MSNGPQLTVKDLQRDGFEKEPPAFSCLVAELPSKHRVIGYALYFPTYSTWRGASMMLEDLYVRPTERKQGVGDKLFEAVAEEAWGAGCSRLDFHVLEWNPARSFYRRKGALDLTAAEGWCYYRLLPSAERAPVPAGNEREDSK
ncbi:thialysine N-epsilon-acetyltransferase-like isoform X2 [Aricia agestis]|nr:thialysine N-epsilon-acetyltransferase-like isoform X2 [Aricia agestis]